MKFESSSLKKEACVYIEKKKNSSIDSKLNYDDVMEAHEVYEKSNNKFRRIKFIPITKFEILYSLIAILLITIILIALIKTGNKIWG